MSEPIQSISQGNYILQGTVATSAGIVGDGSTQNPLRADETVLFDNGTTATKSATLSEPITNFNKIGVLYGDDHYGHRYIEADTSYPFTKWITNYGIDGWNNNTNMIGFRELAWSANGNTIYAITGWQKATVLTATGNWNAGSSGIYGGIIKVIGINRISNN